jgi:uncharacterized membrane protein
MDTNAPLPKPTALSPSRWRLLPQGLLIGIPAAIISLFVLLTPPGLWEKARVIGYALCHQLAERSFFIHEHQTPLCARCTGMYLGFAISVIFLIVRRRVRAARPPAAGIVSVIIGFVTIMGIDGINSTISIIPGAPQLYHTTNVHRIVTGTLFGMGVAMLFLPIFNSAIWAQPTGDRTIKNWRELAILIAVCLGLDAIVLTQADWLFYPIVILSIVGPLFLLGLMGGIIVLTMRNMPNSVQRWPQFAAPLLAGVALGLMLITFMDILRVSVTAGGI